MLNWDEYNNEEAQIAPAVKNTAPKKAIEAEQVIPKEITQTEKSQLLLKKDLELKLLEKP